MELTRDGKLLMVAATLGDYVAFYALPDLALLGTVTTGKTPGWLTLSSDERFLYSSNRGAAENTVSVIDVAARREITRIPVGRLPQRMTTAFVPDRPR
jgi:YVTN family beta-propeller protein